MGSTDSEIIMFSNSGQIILSALLHKFGYSPHPSSEETEAEFDSFLRKQGEQVPPLALRQAGSCKTTQLTSWWGPAESGSRSYCRGMKWVHCFSHGPGGQLSLFVFNLAEIIGWLTDSFDGGGLLNQSHKLLVSLSLSSNPLSPLQD